MVFEVITGGRGKATDPSLQPARATIEFPLPRQSAGAFRQRRSTFMRDAEAALRLPSHRAAEYIVDLSRVAAVDEFNISVKGHIDDGLGNIWVSNRSRELVSYCVSQGYCHEAALALLDNAGE